MQATSATSYAAITVVSAFSTGRGVTIGIDIPCKVGVELKNCTDFPSKILVRGKIADPHHLIATSAENALRHLGLPLPRDKSLFVSVDSKIPTAVGLKSSSAVSSAVVKAVFDFFTFNGYSSQDVLRESCKASIQSGASLTGAFDDAAAGLLGGLVFSDNRKFKLLRHQTLDRKFGKLVKILVPKKKKKLTSDLSLSMYTDYDQRVREAIRFAEDGVLAQAMLLNSIIHSVVHRYSLQPLVSSILEGATASGISGKGPAVAAICPNGKVSERVERRWIDENLNCKVLNAFVTRPHGL